MFSWVWNEPAKKQHILLLLC